MSRAELSAREGFHSFSFELTASSSLTISTVAVVRGQTPDTVIYLYKKNARGSYGSYIARNDDFGGSLFSRISGSFGAGSYRVLVKGYARSERGIFGMIVECSGCTALRQTPNMIGLYYLPSGAAAPGKIRWLNLDVAGKYELYTGSSTDKETGRYALHANGETGSLDLVADGGARASYEYHFDGHDLRLRNTAETDSVVLITTGSEDMCDSTGGHYLDDDANSAGDYCECDDPKRWLPGYGGCVER